MPVVRIGADYDNLTEYNVNDDRNPILVNSGNFTGYITVRLQNHVAESPKTLDTCPYFLNHRRLFSFQFQGRFKATNPRRPDHLWTFDDVLFCAETEKSIQPPAGAALAVKFIRYIDPGFNAEGMFLEKRPWVGSWLVCGMNVINVWRAEQDEKFSSDNACERELGSNLISCIPKGVAAATKPLLPVGPWVYYGRNHIGEDNRMLIPESDRKISSAERRKYFTNLQKRQSRVFDPENVYGCDFFNNFCDFDRMQADMFLRFSISKILRDQPLRFVCRDRGGETIFFVIEIDYSDLSNP